MFGLDLNPCELKQLSASQLCNADLIGLKKLSKLLTARIKTHCIPEPLGFAASITASYPARSAIAP